MSILHAMAEYLQRRLEETLLYQLIADNLLERLIRYMARPPVCTERLSLNEEGQVQYLFKHPWKDGRTHVVLSPLEFIEKLSALVPLPLPSAKAAVATMRFTSENGVRKANSYCRQVADPRLRFVPSSFRSFRSLST